MDVDGRQWTVHVSIRVHQGASLSPIERFLGVPLGLRTWPARGSGRPRWSHTVGLRLLALRGLPLVASSLRHPAGPPGAGAVATTPHAGPYPASRPTLCSYSHALLSLAPTRPRNHSSSCGVFRASPPATRPTSARSWRSHPAKASRHEPCRRHQRSDARCFHALAAPKEPSPHRCGCVPIRLS